jgi:hypothetical protein
LRLSENETKRNETKLFTPLVCDWTVRA